ncbi:diaminopimelate decarboxylase [Paludibacterium yongneupense]|uniref:diaminopimelate decarboxylase n=1 Tax=Paludibacterium yongneupense TaxID=400061 RepID=UPI00041C9A90|nr:diaminopimelate decarboxylase [Paludibacterium yongneupense]
MSIPPEQLKQLIREHGTPLWIYDADAIRRRIAQLRPFDVVRYAQKANSNVHILRLMRDEGVRVDAVSQGEIQRSLAAGYRGEDDGIVFTADLIDHATLATVIEHGIAVNAGSLDMLERVGLNAPGHRVWLRINPGFGHGHSNKTNTGGEHSKHGIWHSDAARAIEIIERHSLQLVGIHIHIGSGVDYEHLARVCGTMTETVKRLGHDIEAISAGGGLSVPYQDGELEVDVEHYFHLWDGARREIAQHLGHPVRLEIEPGRFLVAQSGLLASEIHVVKDTPAHRFALVDAGFNDLVRPSFYGSYHAITLLAHDDEDIGKRPERMVVVAGPLCESGDVFTQKAGGAISGQRLPEPRVGDYLLLHDAGAYGASMSSNYNSRPLAPEVLVENGAARLIRRRQTLGDLLALETGSDAR